MAEIKVARAAGTGGSVPIESCQVCGSEAVENVLFLGYMPPVNQMRTIGELPHEQPSYPTTLLYCSRCELVQLGLCVDQAIIFPPGYPYTSGTTRILRENFAALYAESNSLLGLKREDLIIDIGSNDGTLLSNFKSGSHRVLGIEPTDVGRIAESRGIPTVQRYFNLETAREVRAKHGAARLVTMANCFAHIEDVHAIADGILTLLDDKGVFVSESHYLIGLLDRLQYDTVYHEHLRYYSLRSLSYLLAMHGLEVFHAVPIPTHGGSIRVYAARKGDYPVRASVGEMISREPQGDAMRRRLAEFRTRVMLSKLRLYKLLGEIKEGGGRIYGISAPSRASTLVTYVGLDDIMIDYVCEVPGSLKIGKYLPGTLIPVVEETRLFEDQPECAIIFSWHIAEELAPKLRQKGYRGKLIVPLPDPREI
ncbi:MAG TPA: class I SAM-dependent methyltransferase [Candidatus Binataceae bacterium]|nr:class I SAM-dependent methyltransferase [Candidatus Binataceae bacterium]